MDKERQQELLNRWYETIRGDDSGESVSWKKRIDSRLDDFDDPEQRTYYHLLALRFELLHKDIERAQHHLAAVEPFQETADANLNFLYPFFKGIYFYTRQRYKESVDCFLQAEPYIDAVSDEEAAEYYYKLASSYHRTYSITQSMKSGQKALERFKNLGRHARIADCENLLGINNKDIMQYKEAERHYHDALVHAEKAKNKELKMLIMHNFGSFYSDQNDAATAIIFLKKAKELMEPWENALKVVNLYLLAKNHFKTNQRDKAQWYLQAGLNFSQELGFEAYYFHCSLLKAKYLQRDAFEEVYREGISYFNDKERWDYVVEYGEELGSYYGDIGFYEKAYKYYHLTISARKNIEKERGIANGETSSL
ncbi:MAG TPA: hypothetical protein VFK44_05225 [Bacillales bacterium]|nr:hypothetical protein [Bacillales bacterium]